MKNQREIKAINRTIQILNKPEKWTKKNYATDQNGNTVGWGESQATCYCLEGAILKALKEQKLTDRKWKNSYTKITHAICKTQNLPFHIGNQDAHMGFNDAENTTWAMVINALLDTKHFLKKGNK